MRKLVFFPIIFLLAAFVNSCRKETSQGSSNKEFISKVNTWLDGQKVPTQPNKASNIELLKENLDFSNLSIEESYGGEQIIIVPINENFKTIKNIDQKSIPDLVLIVNKSGAIRKGNVVLSIPENGQLLGKVPEKTFYNIYNTSHVDWDSKFQFLSVTGRRVFELEYRNKNLYSAGIVKKNQENSNNDISRASVIACINWYLVTTYYDEWGNQVDQTTEFINQTCDDCENPMYQSICPDGGGGGTSSETEYEVEWIGHATLNTDVLSIGDQYGGGMLVVNQRLYAKLHNLHPTNDKIRDCYFIRSDVNGNSNGATSTVFTYNVTGLGSRDITISSTGRANLADGSTIPFSDSESFNIGNFAWQN